MKLTVRCTFEIDVDVAEGKLEDYRFQIEDNGLRGKNEIVAVDGERVKRPGVREWEAKAVEAIAEAASLRSMLTETYEYPSKFREIIPASLMRAIERALR